MHVVTSSISHPHVPGAFFLRLHTPADPDAVGALVGACVGVPGLAATVVGTAVGRTVGTAVAIAGTQAAPVSGQSLNVQSVA